MVANARLDTFISLRSSSRRSCLENGSQPSQVPERADIGDDQRKPKLILVPDRSQRKPLVADGKSAARSVIPGLRELVLSNPLLQVITEPGRDVPSFAVHFFVPEQH